VNSHGLVRVTMTVIVVVVLMAEVRMVAVMVKA
jgi:hypothetical protein